jgi:hypothetical protein
MTLFDLLNVLRARGTAPMWEDLTGLYRSIAYVASGVTVELVKTESASVLVRLKGNPDLGRVLQAGK